MQFAMRSALVLLVEATPLSAYRDVDGVNLAFKLASSSSAQSFTVERRYRSRTTCRSTIKSS